MISNLQEEIQKLTESWETFQVSSSQKLNQIDEQNNNITYIKEHSTALDTQVKNLNSKITNIENSLRRKSLKLHSDDNNDKGFSDFIRTGTMSDLETKSLSITVPSEGGYTVAPEKSMQIISMLTENSVMRKISGHDTISTNALELYMEQDGEAFAEWRPTDISPVHDDTKLPRLERVIINLQELYAQPQATQQLLSDTFVDIEKWLMEKVTQAMSGKEEMAFISGTGVGQPIGVMSLSTNDRESDSTIVSDSLTCDKILDLYYKLSEKYQDSACFIMHRSTLQKIRQLKTKDGQYIFQPNTQQKGETLLGVPVYQSSYVPAYGTHDLPIVVFGNFKRGYKIVDHKGMMIIRDKFTNKPFVKFYISRRVGGGVIDKHAIKFLTVTTSK